MTTVHPLCSCLFFKHHLFSSLTLLRRGSLSPVRRRHTRITVAPIPSLLNLFSRARFKEELSRASWQQERRGGLGEEERVRRQCSYDINKREAEIYVMSKERCEEMVFEKKDNCTSTKPWSRVS